MALSKKTVKKPTPKPTPKPTSVGKKAQTPPNIPVSTLVVPRVASLKKLDVAATMAKAIDLHKNGRRRDAYVTCELILRADPRHASAFHLMGIIAIENKDFLLAMRMISESLSVNPNEFFAHNNLGVVYRILKDPLAAAAHFEKAVSLKPDYAEAFNNLGVALGDLNRPKDALVQFKAALKIKPDYEDAKANIDSVSRLIKTRKN